MTDPFLSVDWKTYSTFLQNNYKNLYKSRSFSDVTLVSEDLQSVQAHRNILAGSSPVLEKLISETGTNSVLYLRGISKENLESILQFLYLGETRIQIESFYQFVEICKDLEIADWKNTETINQEVSEELNPFSEEENEKSNISFEKSTFRKTKKAKINSHNNASLKYQTKTSSCLQSFIKKFPEPVSDNGETLSPNKAIVNDQHPYDNGEILNKKFVVDFNCGICFESFEEQIVYLKHMATGHKSLK